MVSDSTSSELPFFPQYETEHVETDKFRVTWFECHFSQSHYNIQHISKGSNACTLIAVLMAGKCNKNKIQISDPDSHLNLRVIHLFALSMLEGNKIHDELKSQNALKYLNLNVPEALSFAGDKCKGAAEWKSEVYMESLSISLHENIWKSWKEWLKTKVLKEDTKLYVVLVADSRTVLFVIQFVSDTITLFDSHQHSAEKGAFVATVVRPKLKLLCEWYVETMSKFYNSEPQLYELSFLHFPK